MSLGKLITGAAFLAAVAGLAGCNSAPVALDDEVMAPSGGTTNIPVLANDSDPNDDPLFVKRAWGAKQGMLTINPDNTVSYTARSGASGTDMFQYRVKDRRGAASNAQVHVNLGRPVVLGTPDRIVVDERPVEAVVVPARPAPEVVVLEEPAPKTVVVTPAAPPRVPMVDKVMVTLHTLEDDKNRDEVVRLVVRRGSEVLGETTVGTGELWGADTERAYEIDLRPDVRLTDVGQLSVDVIKSATGTGTGGGWVFRPEVVGRLDNGDLVTLVETGKSIKLGDGEAKDVSISVPMR
jgi:hypothetical protein